MKRLSEILATWFYLGHLRPGPGTWGTLGAIPLILLLRLLGPISYLVGVMLLTIAAMLVAQAYEYFFSGHDRSEVVIDEVAGFAIAMTWLPATWQAWAAGFILFRVFDIFKPPPIGWLDRQIKGGIGVVADDVAAGVVVNVILQIVFVQTTWLGYQLAL
jgi:phosphatidylglycerophosphatase A